MTTPHKALLQQALEALQTVMADVNTTPNAYEAQRQAIAALQAAIDAPDPEPEALRHSYDGYGWLYVDNGSGSNWKCQQYPDGEFLYTHPPEVRKPLTDAEIIELAKDAGFDTRTFARANTMVVVRHSNGSWVDITEDLEIFVRAIEAAHGIKS